MFAQGNDYGFFKQKERLQQAQLCSLSNGQWAPDYCFGTD